MIARAPHRMRQFFGALRPRLSTAERAEAHGYLSPALRALFESMSLRDQQHGVIVMRRVRARSGDDASLCIAALLHDCGKGEVAVWQRVLHVAAGALPGANGWIASERGAAWRRGMWRLLHHPALGAELAAGAGADADVVRMIREQEAPSPDERLAILQAADEM